MNTTASETLTVERLIEELQKIDGNLEVWAQAADHSFRIVAVEDAIEHPLIGTDHYALLLPGW